MWRRCGRKLITSKQFKSMLVFTLCLLASPVILLLVHLLEQLTVLYHAGIALIMNLEWKYSVYSLEIHTLHSDRMNHSNIRRLPAVLQPVCCKHPWNVRLFASQTTKRWRMSESDDISRAVTVSIVACDLCAAKLSDGDKLWRRPPSAALNSFLELSVPFLNKTVSHMFIFRCSYIFPVSVWKNYCWHCDPFWSCVMEKYSSARDCSKLSITVPGLGHSMSKTVTDKAVSILSGLQLSLSLDRQTPLSHPGDWVTHKIFSSA